MQALTADGRELVALYDEIAAAFSEHGQDCAALTAGIDAAMEAHKPMLLRNRDRNQGLSREQQLAERARIEAAMGGRLTRMRETATEVLATCSRDPALGRIMMRLAKLTAPRRDPGTP